MTFDVILSNCENVFDCESDFVRINELSLDELEFLSEIVSTRDVTLVAYVYPDG